MIKRVLIVTHSGDLHAERITPLLAAKGAPPLRINLDAFPRDYQLSQLIDNARCVNRLRLLPDGPWIDLDTIGAVWMRKAGEFSYLSDDLAEQERAYAALETEQALFSLLYTLDCYWMSHPRALRGALWKGEQLQRARQMGFRVPASIVTNCPDEVRRFRERIAGPIIFKAMSTPTLAADDVDAAQRITGTLTTTIVDDTMLADLDAVRELSCHFQAYIPKRHELRVTVVGRRVFAAALHSQDDPRTVVDSRDMSAPIRYEACNLAPELAQRCVDFVRSYGLEYGAIDLIVTPQDEIVFLENNPAGQFLYVQELVPELRILEALADTLHQEAQCPRQS